MAREKHDNVTSGELERIKEILEDRDFDRD